MRKGLRNRHVSATILNEESSRSHSIFTVEIESKIKEKEGLELVNSSKINFVDLAGSER